jgi:hypothetical protein
VVDKVRYVRILSLCLVAVLAIAAVTASAASAKEPEWGRCVAKTGGKYTNANCTTKGKGGTFEWEKASKVSAGEREFETSTTENPGVLSSHFKICATKDETRQVHCEAGETEEEADISTECTNEHDRGTINAAGSGAEAVNVEFTGCEAIGTQCSNTNTAGKINTEILKGSLGYIDKAKHEVGLRLEPSKKKGTFATFSCGGALGITVGAAFAEKEGPAYPPKGGGDAILSPIEPVDVMTTGLTQVYSYNEALENLPTHFEGKSNVELEDYEFEPTDAKLGSRWSRAGQSITVTNRAVAAHAGEEVELKG